MPEMDFIALRDQLEAQADQPPFAVIRARRAARTRRTVATGAAAAATLVVLAGGVLAATALRRPHAVPVAPPTGTASASVTPSGQPSPTAAGTGTAPPPVGNPFAITSLVRSAGGTLYAVEQDCVTGCTGGAATYRFTLLRSTDLAATWQTVGDVSGVAGGTGDAARLLAGSDTALWLVNGSRVAGSANGGRIWRQWTLPAPPAALADIRVAGPATAGGTAWLASGGTVFVATGGGQPVPTASQPPGAGRTGAGVIGAIDAAGADRATVRVDAFNSAANPQNAWFTTTDRGAHWNALASPCAGTAVQNMVNSTMSTAPDGTVWVVCAGGGGAGQQLKWLVTSSDQGRTWSPPRPLESSGYGTDLIAVSATVAWRSGGRADLYRTGDAWHWADVAVTGDAGGGSGALFLTVVDAGTALYVGRAGGSDAFVTYVTRDGGATWSPHPFPGG